MPLRERSSPAPAIVHCFTAVAAVALLALVLPGAALAQQGSHITLDGEETQVRWSDGDSFRILSGEYQGSSVRLGGFNTLEDYGPIHRWGEWEPAELYHIADISGDFAGAGTWVCTTEGERDRYQRLLVDCPGLTLAMAASGLGHLMAIDEPAAPDAIAAQLGAQAARLGMWAKGVPSHIITSAHSAAEGGDVIYNRLISTRDGSSEQRTHEETYEVCQWVCPEGAESCLMYVPFEQRYGDNRADCLRVP